MKRKSLSVGFLAVCAAAQLTINSSLHAQENIANSDILGHWRWEDDAMKKSGSFSELEFETGGKIVGLSFMSGVFSKGGEVLESGYGSYRLHGDRLSIKPPSKIDSDGWPDRGDDHPTRYICQITMDGSKALLRLDDCPFSGTWTKVAPRS